MDSKRRGGGGGFLKGKLRSLYRASSIKVKPSHLGRSPSPAATEQGGRMTMMMKQQKSSVNMITANKVPSTTTSTATSAVGNQDRLPKHIATASGGGGDSYNAATMDALAGGLWTDETVDHKAAMYISSVLERFRLEYI